MRSRSSFTHCEQHVTRTNGLHRVRHVGVQHDGLPAGKLMPLSFRLDHKLSAEAVNHDVTGCPMFR